MTSKLLIAPSAIIGFDEGVKQGVVEVDEKAFDSAPLLETQRPLSTQVDLQHPICAWPTYPDDGESGEQPLMSSESSESEERYRRADLHLRQQRAIFSLWLYARNERMVESATPFLMPRENLFDIWWCAARIFFQCVTSFCPPNGWILSLIWGEGLTSTRTLRY